MAPTDQLFSLITNQTTQSLISTASTAINNLAGIATIISMFRQNTQTNYQGTYFVNQATMNIPNRENPYSFPLTLFHATYFFTALFIIINYSQNPNEHMTTLLLFIISSTLLIIIYIYRYLIIKLLLILAIFITIVLTVPYLIPLVTQILTANQSSATSIDASPIEQAKNVIEQFYQDINKKDYHAAYYLTANGFSESYSQFAKGFRYTEHDDISLDCIKQLPDGTVQVTITIKATEDSPAGKHISTYYAQYIIGLDHGAYIIFRGTLLPTHSTCSSNSK